MRRILFAMSAAVTLGAVVLAIPASDERVQALYYWYSEDDPGAIIYTDVVPDDTYEQGASVSWNANFRLEDGTDIGQGVSSNWDGAPPDTTSLTEAIAWTLGTAVSWEAGMSVGASAANYVAAGAAAGSTFWMTIEGTGICVVAPWVGAAVLTTLTAM